MDAEQPDVKAQEYKTRPKQQKKQIVEPLDPYPQDNNYFGGYNSNEDVQKPAYRSDEMLKKLMENLRTNKQLKNAYIRTRFKLHLIREE